MNLVGLCYFCIRFLASAGFQYHLELERSCVLPSILLAHVIFSFAPSGDNIIPALFNSLSTIRGSNLGARLRAEVALFDLIVLPPVVVSRQVGVPRAQWRQVGQQAVVPSIQTSRKACTTTWRSGFWSKLLTRI